MKKIILSTMVLGSTVALAACSGSSANDLDGALTGAPYAEERTVGSTGGNVVVSTPSIPAVKSAEPVFENSQVK